MEIKTKTVIIQGCFAAISITKHAEGAYTAGVNIGFGFMRESYNFPSEIVRPNDCGWPEKRGEGGYFTTNPFARVSEWAEGFIIGTLEAANSNDNEKLNRIKNRMVNISPKTNPTAGELKKMASSINKLVDHFGVPALAHLAGESLQTVRNWKLRGRISATAAHKLGQLEMIESLGLTREIMRPDVKSWVQIDFPNGVS